MTLSIRLKCLTHGLWLNRHELSLGGYHCLARLDPQDILDVESHASLSDVLFKPLNVQLFLKTKGLESLSILL